MGPPAIRLEGLTRDFGPVRAVDSLSLEVPSGAVFGFLGPNGAGKTTTIRLLLGLVEPTSGRAEVLGFDTRTQGAEVRARTGALLEHAGLYEHLTAEENLEFHARAWRLPAGERGARIRELLEGMGLWERRAEPAGSWSRGMRQKLGLARALLHRPPVVFLDEPTAGLDVPSAAQLRSALADLVRREGATVFLTTHNMQEAEALCARVAVVRAGTLLAEGSPGELRARKGGSRVEIVARGLGDAVLGAIRGRPEVVSAQAADGRLAVELREGAEAAPLVALLVGAGVQVEEVRRDRASLEEVFLTLVTEERP